MISMMGYSRYILAAAAFFFSCALVRASEEHEWEFSAVLHVTDTDEIYNLVMARDGEEYAEDTMKMAIVKTTMNGYDGMEATEEDAETLWDGSSTAVGAHTSGDMTADNMYTLTFDSDSWMTIFSMKFSSTGYYAFYCEHDLDEFHNDMMPSYLTNSHGDALMFDWISTTAAEEETDKKWGDVIGATVVVWIVTLTGLLVVALPSHLGILPTEVLGKEGFGPTMLRYFAAGVLLSVATSLILFESSHLIAEGYAEEVDTLWRWSVMILLGFITSPVCHIILLAFVVFNGGPHKTALPTAPAEEEVESGSTLAIEMTATEAKAKNEEDRKNAVGAGEIQLLNARNVSIVSGLIFGDFFHNFADGIFIGAAFKLCDTTLAWTLTWATVAHELPQEISDFTVLVNECGYSTPEAILYNVLSGMSVILGGIAVTAADIDDYAVGMLLAYGGGAIVYVACTELFPRGEETDLEKDPHAFSKRVCGIFAFFLGCIVVSLVLLDHEHCSGESSEEESGGHADH